MAYICYPNTQEAEIEELKSLRPASGIWQDLVSKRQRQKKRMPNKIKDFPKIYITFLNLSKRHRRKIRTREWAQSTSCSWKGFQFSTALTSGSWHLPITLVPGELMPSGCWEHCTHMEHIQTSRHTHIKLPEKQSDRTKETGAQMRDYHKLMYQPDTSQGIPGPC